MYVHIYKYVTPTYWSVHSEESWSASADKALIVCKNCGKSWTINPKSQFTPKAANKTAKKNYFKTKMQISKQQSKLQINAQPFKYVIILSSNGHESLLV